MSIPTGTCQKLENQQPMELYWDPSPSQIWMYFYSSEMKLPANTLLQLFFIWAVSLLSWPQWLCSHLWRETQVSLGPTKWGIQVNEDSQISSKNRGSFKEKRPTTGKCVKTWVSPICSDEKNITTNSSPLEDYILLWILFPKLHSRNMSQAAPTTPVATEQRTRVHLEHP